MTTKGTGFRARGATLVAMVVLAAIGAYTFTHLDVTTEITQFLPSSEDRELARIARDMTSSELNRTITLTIQARDADRASVAAADLARRLAKRRDVSWVRRGPEEDFDRAFYELYFPRRYLFYTDEPRADLLDDRTLASRAHELKQRLSSPTGTFVRQIAPSDPLLAFAHHLDRLRAAQHGGLTVSDGQFVSGRHAVVFVGSRHSPFDSAATQRLLSGIDTDFAAVRRTHGRNLRLEQSGIHRFAVRSEAAIRNDVTRISLVSTIGCVVLFVVLFGSLRHLALSMVPLGAGMVVGLAVTQLAFGRVHGLGLAFGSSLIGVAVDYVSHYMNHHTLAPDPRGPFGTLRRILPGLGLGAGTTIAGLAGLAWTGFPGISELATLTTVGVSAALIATCLLVPPWMPRNPKPTRVHLFLARTLTRALERLRRSRLACFGIPIVALVLCIVGLPQLRWIDDIRALNTLDPEVLAEDQRVRARVTRMDAGRFVIAWGEDEEQALIKNDEVYRRLCAAEAAGELDAMQSLHALLWSGRAQRASSSAVTRSPHLYERTITALEREGFVRAPFAPFGSSLQERPAPLTWRDIAGSPLGRLASSFRVSADDGRVGFITLLRGADLDALQRRLGGISGVRVFDQTRFMDAAYRKFRTRTIEMVALGLIGVFLMIFLRYRRLGPSIAAFFPAVLASASAFAILPLVGLEANFMHLLALLLVLSMGEDYSVFMVEARSFDEEIGNTMTSVLVACLTTILSFGLLAMSENPALRALGLVTGLGVLFSFVLAPAAWVFLPPEKRR